VSTIRGAAHGQQENVLVQGILEGQGHGDGSSLTGQVRLYLEDALNSVGGGNIVGVLERGNPGLAGMEALDLNGVLGSELGKLSVDVLDNVLVDFLGDHVRNRADRELSNDLGGDHSLGSSGGEGSLNSVEGEGGVTPATLQGINVVVMDGVGSIDGVVESLQAEVQGRVGSLFSSYFFFFKNP